MNCRAINVVIEIKSFFNYQELLIFRMENFSKPIIQLVQLITSKIASIKEIMVSEGFHNLFIQDYLIKCLRRHAKIPQGETCPLTIIKMILSTEGDLVRPLEKILEAFDIEQTKAINREKIAIEEVKI